MKYDSRRFDENVLSLLYDDSLWENAQEYNAAFLGQYRECECEEITEAEIISPVCVERAGDFTKYDFGRNISGYVRLTVNQDSGDEITIRYAEALNDDGTIRYDDMRKVFPRCDFQTEIFVCNGKKYPSAYMTGRTRTTAYLLLWS